MNVTHSHTGVKLRYNPSEMTCDQWIKWQQGKADAINAMIPLLRNIEAAEASGNNKDMFLALGAVADAVPDPNTIPTDDWYAAGYYNAMTVLEEEATERPRNLRVNQFRKAQAAQNGQSDDEDKKDDGCCGTGCGSCGGTPVEKAKASDYEFHFGVDSITKQVCVVFEMVDKTTVDSGKLIPLVMQDRTFVHQRDGIFTNRLNSWIEGYPETVRQDDAKRAYLSLEVLGFTHVPEKDTFRF